MPTTSVMSIQVIKPGMLSTVQDLGRWGYQNFGVPVAGPMDRCAHRLANLLVGNPPSAATVEVTLIGPELAFEARSCVAVTGAEFDIHVGDRPVPMNAAFEVPAGSHVRLGRRRQGTRAYLAVAGGIDVPAPLGSRATHLPSRVGGVGGRALVAGDRLPIGPPSGAPPVLGHVRRPIVPVPRGGSDIRVMLGPQDHACTPSGLEVFRSSRYVVSEQSDRMGYRLRGPAVGLRPAKPPLSDPTPQGTVQIPGSGQPIVLMADGQTTGGYPKVATVITADLPLAGQLGPGDWIEFKVCNRAVAMRALIAQEQALLV